VIYPATASEDEGAWSRQEGYDRLLLQAGETYVFCSCPSILPLFFYVM
jgi:hypothetical protein